MKRRKFSKDFKIMVVKQAMTGTNKSNIARRYILNPGVISRWINEFKQGKI
ncbi:transposase [Anaerobacillus sp. MEB173]|uniref:transposase n=1 Tax=Anaerobacillus sp. MEB173 TaxID=3383345 RepID=UPI003F91904C